MQKNKNANITEKNMKTDYNSMMILRPFSTEDASKILRWCISKHAFRLWSADRYHDFPAQPEDIIKQYEGEGLSPLTAVVDNVPIGHILLRYPTNDHSIVRFGFVIVDNELRGKGCGKHLLQLAIDYAKHHLGASKITLGVFSENTSALKCYESVGFSITGKDSYMIDGEEWSGVEMELMVEK